MGRKEIESTKEGRGGKASQGRGRREKETPRRSRNKETGNDASPKRKATSCRQGRRSQSIRRRRCSRRKERNDQNQRAIGGREKDLPCHQNQTPRCRKHGLRPTWQQS